MKRLFAKKFQKKQFLDLTFKFFFKTPHPNPLPTSGERGMEGIFLLKKWKYKI
jgi:hypothetical protein